MPLLRDGHLIDNDNWVVYRDESELPLDTSKVLVSLSRYLELQTSDSSQPGGVLLTTTDDVQVLNRFLDQLALVGIDFPVFTDGRGFSQARLLRKRLGYQGEIRAIGDIREDQVLFMLRSGIDSFDFKNTPDTHLLNTLVSRFTLNYQPSYALPASTHQ